MCSSVGGVWTVILGLVNQIFFPLGIQIESCLRLLKEFSPKNFGPKTLRCGDTDFEEERQVSFGKKHQVTDQLVELPIEHQIYDMIDAAGLEGLTVMEVCALLLVFALFISMFLL